MGLETRTSGSAMFFVDFERLGLAGIPQVVFHAVLLAPGNRTRSIHIGVVVAAFGMEDRLHPLHPRTRLAVFDAAGQVVLDVLHRSAHFYRFAQLGTRSIVQKLDGIPCSERDHCRQI